MAVSARNLAFDNIKFILITLVVLGHIIGPLSNDSHLMGVIFDFIYLFHMPAFLFVSGLFAKKIYTSERGLKVNTVVYYFIMFFIMYSLLFLWQVGYGLSPKYNLFSVGNISWYFFAVGGLSLSLPLLSRIRGGAKTVLPILLVVGIVVGFDTRFNDFLCLGRIVVYAPFYYAGYFLDIKKASSHLKARHDSKVSIAVAIIFLGGVFAICFFAPQLYVDAVRSIATAHNPYEKIHALSTTQAAFVRFGWYFLAAAMIYALCVLVPYKKLPITSFGARSMQVYFLHPFVYYPLSDLGFYEAFINPNMPISLIVIVAIGLTLPVLLALPKFPERVFKGIRSHIQIQQVP